jgi:hypothetical protein
MTPVPCCALIQDMPAKETVYWLIQTATLINSDYKGRRDILPG